MSADLPPVPVRRSRPLALVRMGPVLLLYAAMSMAAVAWGLLRGPPDLITPDAVPMGPWAANACGLGLGLAAVLLSRGLLVRVGRVRHLSLRMARLLGPLDGPTILVLAVVSAVAEELLFRGAMQPTLGLVPSALIFGGLHIGPDRSFWPWTLNAAVMGLALGGLVWGTGSVLPAVLAHFTINFFNFHQLERLRRALDEAPSPC